MRASPLLVSLFVAGVVVACKDPPSQPLATGELRPTFALFGNGAAEVLGGLDLGTYCQSLGFARFALTKPRFGPNAAYDNWRCETESGEVHPFSFEQACKFQNGLEAAQAHPTDPDDAFTWVCYTAGNIGNATELLGRLDQAACGQTPGAGRLRLTNPLIGATGAACDRPVNADHCE